MRRMMSDSETLWEKPIAVFGYNDAIDLFGGWLFEAETNCIEEHNMGQVASSGTIYIRTVSKEGPRLTRILGLGKNCVT